MVGSVTTGESPVLYTLCIISFFCPYYLFPQYRNPVLRVIDVPGRRLRVLFRDPRLTPAKTAGRRTVSPLKNHPAPRFPLRLPVLCPCRA